MLNLSRPNDLTHCGANSVYESKRCQVVKMVQVAAQTGLFPATNNDEMKVLPMCVLPTKTFTAPYLERWRICLLQKTIAFAFFLSDISSKQYFFLFLDTNDMGRANLTRWCTTGIKIFHQGKEETPVCNIIQKSLWGLTFLLDHWSVPFGKKLRFYPNYGGWTFAFPNKHILPSNFP